MSVPSTYRAVLSPCIGICSLDAGGLCAGCLRTADEIAAWPRMDDDQRLRWIEQVLPLRESERE